MSLRTALLPALDQIDRVLGPSALDLRPTTVTIVTRFYVDGERTTDPAGYSDQTLVLPNWIKVRHVTTREIAASGGLYEDGDVVIGPIRPPFTRFDGTSGGFTEAQVAPMKSPTLERDPITGQGVEAFYSLAPGPNQDMGITGTYKLREYKRDKSFRHMLIVGRTQAQT